jgi:hypothetical protein
MAQRQHRRHHRRQEPVNILVAKMLDQLKLIGVEKAFEAMGVPTVELGLPHGPDEQSSDGAITPRNQLQRQATLGNDCAQVLLAMTAGPMSPGPETALDGRCSL